MVAVVLRLLCAEAFGIRKSSSDAISSQVQTC